MKKIGKLVAKHPLAFAAGAAGLGWLLLRKSDSDTPDGVLDLSGLMSASFDPDQVDADAEPTPSPEPQPEPVRVQGPEKIESILWYPYNKWILGEGKAKLNQWAELAGSLLSATGTALAPVMGPIASTAVSTIANVIGQIKTKDRWVTAPPGVWRTVALVDGKPRIKASLKWGREKYGTSGIRHWMENTPRNKSGHLPITVDTEDYTSIDPARKYVYDGTSKNVAKGVTWVQPPGEPMPELWVAVDGGQTEILLWMPARGGDAKDGRYFYDLDLEVS